MATKTTKTNSAIVPAKSPTLDHWVGPHQHLGTGVSTDPLMQAPSKGTKKTPGREPQTPVV